LILDSTPDRERHFALIGAVSGFLTVAGGAFGAHALEGTMSAERFEWFQTAVRWQGLHALAIVAAGFASGRRYGRFAPAAGWLFAAGTVIFCGSLYLLAFTGARGFGAITPIGGVLWLAGWMSLTLSAVKRRDLVIEIEDDAETVVRTAR
jgi:uncharacterized membrane protein YgdD (TMEM256/DUF423 family)